jgi:hypothetical protein
MNLRFAAITPWCREAAVPVLVLACIAASGSAPGVTAAKPTVDRLTPTLAADAKRNDANVNAASSSPAKLDDSSVAREHHPAEPNKIDLAAVSAATPEMAPSDVAAAAPDPTPAPVAVASAAPDQIVIAALTRPTETLPGDTTPDEAASPDAATAPPGDAGIEIVDDCLVLETCVDRYLWTLYRRAPKEDAIKVEERRQVTVKRKGKQITVTRTVSHVADEDFAWKDPKAADRANMALVNYVIGGMDRDFKLRLFQMLHAAERAGLSPGITSGFRDDYRQSIASGLKAADNRSYHGGSLRGGYGHGLAADIVSIKGASRADRLVSTNILWKWIDANGKDFGIGRPYMDRDPPHCAPIDGQEYAKHHPGRAARHASLPTALAKHQPVRATRQASLATARKLVMATH